MSPTSSISPETPATRRLDLAALFSAQPIQELLIAVALIVAASVVTVAW